MQKPNFNSPYATQFTRTGKVNMSNRKPYRNAWQKLRAREWAEVSEYDGAWRSYAPRSYHPSVQ